MAAGTTRGVGAARARRDAVERSSGSPASLTADGNPLLLGLDLRLVVRRGPACDRLTFPIDRGWTAAYGPRNHKRGPLRARQARATSFPGTPGGEALWMARRVRAT